METQNEKILVVGDLHIGFEERFIKEGLLIEPSVSQMMADLLFLLETHAPDRLFLLGDIKDSFYKVTPSEWKIIPDFLSRLSNVIQTDIIIGNHDGGLKHLLPKDSKVRLFKFVKLDNIALLHGHTKPDISLHGVDRIIIGHLHPTYSKKGSPLSGKPMWIVMKARRDLIFEGADGLAEIVVVPSFNKELSLPTYRSERRKIISPIVRKVQTGLEEGHIITLEGDIIGDESSLKYVM
ncbi:MAG: hypothetical protein ACE5KG_06195 [Nitrososphaerales archaeon]